jgi:formamidopyrimidine-DNA glycosylase
VPELPEVETVARQLDQLVAGRRITRLKLADPKLRLDVSKVRGCRIARVRRSGKRIVFELMPPRRRRVALWLCVHLRMTGRLLWQAQRDEGEPGKARAVFELDRGRLLFRDTRRFGTLELCEEFKAVLPAGLEPLSPELDAARLAELLADSPTPLKTWLLRQDRLVGIGNIYASEICHAARLDPRRPAGGLTRREVQRLLSAIRRVLRAAIRHCGTTFSDFQDSRGRTGGYVRYLKVYARKGRPCRACGTAIEQIVQQQRSTYFCPTCQANPRN